MIGAIASTVLDPYQYRFVPTSATPRIRSSDRAAVVADLHLRHAGKRPRYLVRFEHLQAELDVREHDIGRAAAMIFRVWPYSFLLLILQLANLPLRRSASTMKPPPCCSESALNPIWFARPFLMNTWLHSSACVAHAPDRSTACASPGRRQTGPHRGNHCRTEKPTHTVSGIAFGRKLTGLVQAEMAMRRNV